MGKQVLRNENLFFYTLGLDPGVFFTDSRVKHGNDE